MKQGYLVRIEELCLCASNSSLTNSLLVAMPFCRMASLRNTTSDNQGIWEPHALVYSFSSYQTCIPQFLSSSTTHYERVTFGFPHGRGLRQQKYRHPSLESTVKNRKKLAAYTKTRVSATVIIVTYGCFCCISFEKLGNVGVTEPVKCAGIVGQGKAAAVEFRTLRLKSTSAPSRT